VGQIESARRGSIPQSARRFDGAASIRLSVTVLASFAPLTPQTLDRETQKSALQIITLVVLRLCVSHIIRAERESVLRHSVPPRENGNASESYAQQPAEYEPMSCCARTTALQLARLEKAPRAALSRVHTGSLSLRGTVNPCEKRKRLT
jgi:hypothetical protein